MFVAVPLIYQGNAPLYHANQAPPHQWVAPQMQMQHFAPHQPQQPQHVSPAAYHHMHQHHTQQMQHVSPHSYAPQQQQQQQQQQQMHHQQQQLAQYCNYYPGPPQGRGLPAQGEKNLGQQVFFGQIIRVAGDGRCLFRAIARHIASMERRTLDQRAEQKRADELRALAHKTVSVDRKDWFQKSGAIEGDFSEYCRAMKKPDFYGSEVELLALSGAMEQAMTVFLPHKISGFRAIAEYGQEFKHLKPVVCLLYNGKNHYDCLV